MLTQTDDASFTLYSEQYEQTYHSGFGAVAESMHVFVHGSGIYNRLKRAQRTRILEIGFGLGLNCLLSADEAEKHQTTLHYTGIEHSPITAEVFTQLGYHECLSQPRLNQDLATLFAKIEPAGPENLNNPANPTIRQQLTHELADFTQLRLIIADATQMQLAAELDQNQRYDAIYLDAFSPEHNPECWTQSFFEQLAKLITPDGRLATYCVKGVVRRNLESAGFQVTKYPGPTGKREVLWACLKSPAAT